MTWNITKILAVAALVSVATGCATRTGYLGDTRYEKRYVRQSYQGVEPRSGEQPDLIVYDYSEPPPASVTSEAVFTRTVERAPSKWTEPVPAAPAVKPIHTGGDDDLLPPNAMPGECYARVYIPPVYETVEEEVLVQEAAEKVEVVPSEYEWAEQEVMVSEPAEKVELVPAVYDWVEEDVMVTPPSTRVETVAAEYEWVEERVMVKPAHTVWKKGRGLTETLDNATGEIMCLVEIPAEYEVVRKQVLKTPATTQTIEIPAEYKAVKKKIMVKPPSTHTVTIPAEYETVKVRRLVRPEQKHVTPIEARYGTVTKQVLASEGRTEWRRVLCETNLTPELVRRLQEQLLSYGYDPGPLDGRLGDQTSVAIRRYQEDHGLAVGGLTMETLQRLGVSMSAPTAQVDG